MPNDTLDEIEARWPVNMEYRATKVVTYAEAWEEIRTLIEMVRARDRESAWRATDLARPRGSTPSQEDTGPVSGTAIRALVNKQAEDDGLWFIAQNASEAYLQHELRKLHFLIESTLDTLAPPPNAASDPGSASNTDAAQASTPPAQEPTE